MAAIHPRFASLSFLLNHHHVRQALYRDFPRSWRQTDPWNRPKSTISLCAVLSGILKSSGQEFQLPNPKFWEVGVVFFAILRFGGGNGKKKGILRVFGGPGICDTFATHLRHICDTSATHLRHMCDTFATHLRHICDTFGRPNRPKQRFWARFHAKRPVLAKTKP